MIAALLALGLITAVPVVDYALVIEGQQDQICAKTQHDCETARSAIAHGWWLPEMQLMKTICIQHPNCFDARSNCIPGYYGSRAEGYCR